MFIASPHHHHGVTILLAQTNASCHERFQPQLFFGFSNGLPWRAAASIYVIIMIFSFDEHNGDKCHFA